MKRSEFIKKVLKSTRNTVFVNEEQVENSLMIFESLGMLPPSRDQTMGEMCNLPEDDPEYDVKSSFQCREWEQEDE